MISTNDESEINLLALFTAIKSRLLIRESNPGLPGSRFYSTSMNLNMLKGWQVLPLDESRGTSLLSILDYKSQTNKSFQLFHVPLIPLTLLTLKLPARQVYAYSNILSSDFFSGYICRFFVIGQARSPLSDAFGQNFLLVGLSNLSKSPK